MFKGIFAYIDRIVHLVKPRQMLYMAIDGVAPRAKMNQQRSRRFRSAQDLAEAATAARAAGEIIDDSKIFDSNCITPGTEFMEKLSKHLDYFIAKKMREDSLWQRMKVIYSGHDVPGEGEHKIMDYIRSSKMTPGYPPNIRHCLYGLDADLVMLALVSHEPHFCLLREEIDFGFNRPARDTHDVKVVTRQTNEVKWQLLHISLLRQYLFHELGEGAPAWFNLERAMDDFVFMCMLCGNDFVPHLPSLDIREGAIELLFTTYKAMLTTLGGYLVDRAVPDLERLQLFIVEIAKTETDIFERRAKDAISFRKKQERYASQRKKRGGGSNGGFDRPVQAPLLCEMLVDAEAAVLGDRTPEEKAAALAKELAAKAAAESAAAGGASATKTGEAAVAVEENPLTEVQLAAVAAHTVDKGMATFKKVYYRQKLGMGLTASDEPEHRRLQKEYISALCWTLRYYYDGCPSQTWFYPFHYTPLASDLVHVAEEVIVFENATPLLPFEQLIANLPPASSNFLPKPYAALMTMSWSPILAWYPIEFTVDREGCRAPWEGVNLLPFISDAAMFAAIKEHAPPATLTANERSRNSHGVPHIFWHDPTMTEDIPSPSSPKDFPLLRMCMCRNAPFRHPERPETKSIVTVSTKTADPSWFVPQLCPGAMAAPGFPNVNYGEHQLPLQIGLKKIGINLFGSRPSTNPTMTMTMPVPDATPDTAAVAEAMLGHTCFYGWPHHTLSEGLVIGISDGQRQYDSVRTVTRPIAEGASCETVEWVNRDGKHFPYKMLDEERSNEWRVVVQQQIRESLVGRAKSLGTGGMEVGESTDGHIILDVLPLVGMLEDNATGARKKVFAERKRASVRRVLFQLSTKSIPLEDPRLSECDATPLLGRFPLGSGVVLADGTALHGCCGIVVGQASETLVRVQLHVPEPEPPFGLNIARALQEKSWVKSGKTAQLLKMKSTTLGRLSGGAWVSVPTPGSKSQSYNVGLQLKGRSADGGTIYLPGFVRNVEGQRGWEYSHAAIRLIAAYKLAWPKIVAGFDALAQDERTLDAGRILGAAASTKLPQVLVWLSQLPTTKIPRVPTSSAVMSPAAVKSIEQTTAAIAQQAMMNPTQQVVDVTADVLLRPPVGDYMAPIRVASNPLLGERVLNVRLSLSPSLSYSCIIYV